MVPPMVTAFAVNRSWARCYGDQQEVVVLWSQVTRQSSEVVTEAGVFDRFIT